MACLDTNRIALYVDDIIVVRNEPMQLIEKFKETYSLSAETYIANSVLRNLHACLVELREEKYLMREASHAEIDDSACISKEGEFNVG
jgi:hypothetical protein